MILLIGLAVGVDYSLFYLRREREERAPGARAEAALEAAAATSGRAVLVSGLTVMVAMAGMFFAGASVVHVVRHRHDPRRRRRGARLAHRAAGAAVASSATGSRRARVPFLGAARPRRRRVAACGLRSSTACCARPVVSVVLSARRPGRAGDPGAGHAHGRLRASHGLPRNLPIMQTYDRIQAAFPGGPMPAPWSWSRPTTSPPRRSGKASATWSAQALATGQMHEPVTHRRQPRPARRDRLASRWSGNGTDDASDARAGRRCATRRDPGDASARSAAPSADVTGMTAGSKDFNDLMKSHAADRVRVRPRRWRSCCCW